MLGVAINFHYSDDTARGKPVVYLAGFLTLRLTDLMTDWALYCISLQNESLDRAYTSAAGTADTLRTASLVFCITGTLFFIAAAHLALTHTELGNAVVTGLRVPPCRGVVPTKFHKFILGLLLFPVSVFRERGLTDHTTRHGWLQGATLNSGYSDQDWLGRL